MLFFSDRQGPRCKEKNTTDNNKSQAPQGKREGAHTEENWNIWSYLRNSHTYLPDGVIDDYGVGVLQQASQFHGNFSESHATTAKDLNSGVEHESNVKI